MRLLKQTTNNVFNMSEFHNYQSLRGMDFKIQKGNPPKSYIMVVNHNYLKN